MGKSGLRTPPPFFMVSFGAPKIPKPPKPAHRTPKRGGISGKSSAIMCVRMVLSEDFSLLVTFLLVTFPWLFRSPHLLGKQCLGLFRGFCPHFG